MGKRYQNLVTTYLKFIGKYTTILLDDHFETFIEESIQAGRFHNASEVVRAGLRLLEDEENKVKSLKKAIIHGTKSGRNIHFDPKKHLELLKSNKK